jgi:hypothetical protein
LCALGALSLLFVDLDKRERIHHAVMLREIVDDMIANQEGIILSVRVALFMWNTSPTLPFQRVMIECRSSSTGMQALHEASSPAVRQCATERQVVSEKDEHVPYIPILKGDKLLAVLQLNQKESLSKGFTPADQQIARVMAHTVFLWTAWREIRTV